MTQETLDRYFFGLSCLYNELNNNNIKISSFRRTLIKCELPSTKMRDVLIELNVVYYKDGCIKWNNSFKPTKTLSKTIYKNLYRNKLYKNKVNSETGIIRRFLKWIY